MFRNNKKTQRAASSRDLDETRRLAYMLLSGASTDDRDLAGTLVNALVHHQQAAGVDDAIKQVTALLSDPQNAGARSWMMAHVNRISTVLGG